MVKRDGAYTRSERLKEMRRFFISFATVEKPDPLAYRKIVAMFSMTMGLTKEKIREYMGIIEDLEEITINESADQIIIKGVSQ
jgi:hypothetical protein